MFRFRGIALTALLSLALPVAAARAEVLAASAPELPQQAGGSSAGPVDGAPSGTLRVYLMTVGQGRAIWEHFGHNALVIEDVARGTRVAWHWGLFDFDEPGFVARFLRGEMEYWMGGFDATRLALAYQSQDREVVLQELALTQAQARELDAFVRWNAQPENRYYRYDYFVDNCSTRLRDALDRVMGGALQERFGRESAGVSYRHETDRLTGRALPDYLGITLLLGPRGDVIRSKWEQMFTPLNLRIWVRDVEVEGPDGLRPLVRSEQIVVPSSRPPPLAEPPKDLIPLLLAGSMVGGLFLVLGRMARRPGLLRRVPLALTGGLWSLVAGVGGAILVLVHWTDHVWMYGNENVLQLDPLSLLLAVALPLGLLRGGTLKRTTWLAMAVAGVSLTGMVAQVLPGVDQVNGVIIAMALPPNLGLAMAVRGLRTSEAVSSAASNEQEGVDDERA